MKPNLHEIHYPFAFTNCPFRGFRSLKMIYHVLSPPQGSWQYRLCANTRGWILIHFKSLFLIIKSNPQPELFPICPPLASRSTSDISMCANYSSLYTCLPIFAAQDIKVGMDMSFWVNISLDWVILNMLTIYKSLTFEYSGMDEAPQQDTPTIRITEMTLSFAKKVCGSTYAAHN